MPPSIAALADDVEPDYEVVADPPAEADRPPRHLRPAPEPGDGLIAVSSAAMAGINAVGLGLAVASRVLRFRRLPSSLQGAVITLDHQPQLRRMLEERIGKRATATALGMATTAVNALAAAPSMLAVDLAINTIRAAEARADTRAWARREPELARPAARPAQRTTESRRARSTTTSSAGPGFRRSAPPSSPRPAATRNWPAMPRWSRCPKPPGPRTNHSPPHWAAGWPTGTKHCRSTRTACVDWTASTW